MTDEIIGRGSSGTGGGSQQPYSTIHDPVVGGCNELPVLRSQTG